VKIKTVEALQYGVPTVATSVGAEASIYAVPLHSLSPTMPGTSRSR